MEEPLYSTWFNERSDKVSVGGVTPPVVSSQGLDTAPLLMSPSSESNTPKDAAYSSFFLNQQGPVRARQAGPDDMSSTSGIAPAHNYSHFNAHTNFGGYSQRHASLQSSHSFSESAQTPPPSLQAGNLSSIHAGNPLLMSWMNDVDQPESQPESSQNPQHDVDFMSHIDDVLQQTFLDLQSLTPPPSASPSVNPDQFEQMDPPVPVNMAFEGSSRLSPLEYQGFDGHINPETFFAAQQQYRLHQQHQSQHQRQHQQTHQPHQLQQQQQNHHHQASSMGFLEPLQSSGFNSWSADFQSFGPNTKILTPTLNSDMAMNDIAASTGASNGAGNANIVSVSPQNKVTKKPRKSSVSMKTKTSSSPPRNLVAPNSSSPTSDSLDDRKRRKQSESRMPLPELYARMGLENNHEEAKIREQRILNLLKDQGFELAHKTWIRDTDEDERKKIISEIYNQTFPEYGYSEDLIEVIVRRGSYYLMQGRLRRLRRNSRRALMEEKKSKLQEDFSLDQALDLQQDLDLPADFMNEFDEDL